MHRLALLAATFVMFTGLALGQSQTTSPVTDDGRSTVSPDQTERQTQPTSPLPPSLPDANTTANPDRSNSVPGARLPSSTIDDQQPGRSAKPSSTMGTTGSTPGTEPAPEGNKSVITPKNGQTPDDNSMAKPHTSDDTYSSGSSNPSSSANGASSNDASGTPAKHDKSNDNTDPQTTTPHIATHTPDPGTEPNPASLMVPVASTSQN